ncbi:MAG: VOC family protein [Anaerolineales bacterium]|nr:VOC family protein [Anaerolineales bacterium]
MTDFRPPIAQQVTFLHAQDLQETADFYEQILGLELVLDQGSCRIYRSGGDAYLGFCQTLGQHMAAAPATSHIMLTLVTPDVDGWHAYLVGQGVVIEKPPTLNETFNIYQCFVRDPNGYLIEIQTFLDPNWPGGS